MGSTSSRSTIRRLLCDSLPLSKRNDRSAVYLGVKIFRFYLVLHDSVSGLLDNGLMERRQLLSFVVLSAKKTLRQVDLRVCSIWVGGVEQLDLAHNWCICSC